MLKNIRKTSLTVLCSCLLYAISPLALAEEYKCYVKLENDEYKIIYSQADRDYKATAAARHRHVLRKGKKIKVSEVIECTKTNQSFSSDKANELFNNRAG